MHEGVPRGGPLVPELLARANAAVGNGPGDAAIELLGGSITIALRDADALVATSEGEARSMLRGDAWSIEPLPAYVSPTRYIAVSGGIDVPVLLGGRGTLLVAGLGGHRGRLLQRGDRLPVGAARGTPRPLPDAPDSAAPVRVLVGPDVRRFLPETLDLFFASPFQVNPRSDRVGLRLDGPPLPRIGEDVGVSAPMVRGAIQVPSSGSIVVLGPDHPTIGGYPVIATVVARDWGSLWARRAGAEVRFVPADR
jgi:allophanate hydrolase subunit 2